MTPLSASEIEHFLRYGYVVVPGALDLDATPGWVDRGWERIGVSPDDPGAWGEERVHLSGQQRLDTSVIAPRALAAAVQLLGGADRVDLPWSWSDAFIANLGVGKDRQWDAPSADVGGWHQDGDFFRHFLDSPEQGLLTIALWTDMHHRGGGTFIATDSVGVVARHLAEHPEGLRPDEMGTDTLIQQCHEFVELTGQAGDVVLMHPFMLHATSQNVIGHGRLITNPPVALREPMRYDRSGDDHHSAVERAVLNGLGVDRHTFRPTAPRELITPDRVRRQRERDAQETDRLHG